MFKISHFITLCASQKKRKKCSSLQQSQTNFKFLYCYVKIKIVMSLTSSTNSLLWLIHIRYYIFLIYAKDFAFKTISREICIYKICCVYKETFRGMYFIQAKPKTTLNLECIHTDFIYIHHNIMYILYRGAHIDDTSSVTSLSIFSHVRSALFK